MVQAYCSFAGRVSRPLGPTVQALVMTGNPILYT